MKRRLTTLAIFFTVLTVATAAIAQPADRDLGVFSDRNATSSRISGPAFAPFFFYVLGWNLDGEVKGFEFSLSVPADVVVLARIFDGPWLNVGSGDNFIVGTGGCLPSDGVWFNLVCYQAGIFVPVPPNDLLVCLDSATPSSFLPPAPGYLTCDGTLVPFGAAQNGGGVYPDGCGVINATDPSEFPIATEAESFGSLKARF